jgi:hypothetical protein
MRASVARYLALAGLLAAAMPLQGQQGGWKPVQQRGATGRSPSTPPPSTTPAPSGQTPGYGGGWHSGGYYDQPDGYGYPPADLPNCTVTFSGALTGTFGCSFVQATWRTGERIGVVRIASNPGQAILNRPSLEVSVGFPGAPAAGATHTYRDAVQGSALVVSYNGAQWMASAGGPSLPSGGYALRLSRAEDAGDVGYGRAYSIGGTLTADLQPYSGASRVLHVEVRF